MIKSLRKTVFQVTSDDGFGDEKLNVKGNFRSDSMPGKILSSSSAVDL